jgi:uncharacterized protein
MYRIGVIADTHIPEFLPALPAGIIQRFQGVDMIVHLGDITGAEVLDELKLIAPVVAVKGDHDALDLPQKTVIEVGSVRIGLIHGRRPRWQEAPSILSNLLFGSRRFWWGGFQRQVVHSFHLVDAILFGHFHRPYLAWHDGILLFNPGAVYLLTPETLQARFSQTPSFFQRIFLHRWRQSLPGIPTVGILTIEDGKISAEILPVSN